VFEVMAGAKGVEGRSGNDNNAREYVACGAGVEEVLGDDIERV
jgi:hypothetical protein